MALLAKLAREELKKRASIEFDKIDLQIYEEIILPLEENVDLYQQKSDAFIEFQERVNTAYEAYEDIQAIRTNIKRARQTADAAEKTADATDKGSTIASALDKISAAISFGLKKVKERLRFEIDELKKLEQLFAPTKIEFEIRKGRILRVLQAQKDRFDKITENRRKQQEKITAKRRQISERRNIRLQSGVVDVSGPVGQAYTAGREAAEELRDEIVDTAEGFLNGTTNSDDFEKSKRKPAFDAT